MITYEELEAAYNALVEPSKDAEGVFNSIVKNLSEGLDEVMQEIYTEVILQEDPPIDKIQTLFLKLGNYVYFFGSEVEKVGLTSDIAENMMKEKYNVAYNDNLINTADGKKRTANELTAIAEAFSLSETVLNDIYKRVYKTIKFKVDTAQSMVNSLSKVLSKRMQEMNFSKGFDDKSTRILME